MLHVLEYESVFDIRKIRAGGSLVESLSVLFAFCITWLLLFLAWTLAATWQWEVEMKLIYLIALLSIQSCSVAPSLKPTSGEAGPYFVKSSEFDYHFTTEINGTDVEVGYRPYQTDITTGRTVKFHYECPAGDTLLDGHYECLIDHVIVVKGTDAEISKAMAAKTLEDAGYYNILLREQKYNEAAARIYHAKECGWSFDASLPSSEYRVSGLVCDGTKIVRDKK